MDYPGRVNYDGMYGHVLRRTLDFNVAGRRGRERPNVT